MRFAGWIARESEECSGLLFYPVSRKLAVGALAYLAGIICSQWGYVSLWWAGALSCILLTVCWIYWKTRRSALLLICALLFVAGNCAAGIQLSITDAPTPTGTPISGTVTRIESEYRVMLEDVVLSDGAKTNRPVVVTLMIDEEGEKPQPPLHGQRITGIGRLFAQDGVRNPGGIDQRLRALCDGYELSGYILSGWTADGDETFSFMEMFRQLRKSLSNRLNLVFKEQAPLFSAILLGEKGDIDQELTLAMQLTGTAHILSVSGMHLSMVSAVLYAILKKVPIGRKTACLLQAVGMVCYAGLTGFAVGTVRALVMSLLGILSRLRARRYDPLTALALAAFLITAFCPLMVFDAGFQFSFYVVLGIHLLRTQIKCFKPVRWIHDRIPWLCDMMIISTCAQIAAVPVQLSLYGFLPVFSLPMNLLCGMILPLLMIIGWMTMGISLIFPLIGTYIGGMMTHPLGVYERVLSDVAGMRGSVIRLPALKQWMLVLHGTALALVSSQIRFGRMRYAVCAAVILITAAAYLPAYNPETRYVQLDVGQGDASLLREGRSAVVIDAGPQSSYDLLRYLRHEGLKVEAVILSHLDEDHAGALGTLLASEVDVARVIMPERATEDVYSDAVLDGLSLLKDKGITPEFVRAGDTLDILNMRFDVLSPNEGESGSNERSLLLDVHVNDWGILTTGDLPSGSEPNGVPKCDVLKVAHHGSKNASSPSFLAEASPEIALISVGRNSYGHPHPRVLQDLDDIGASVYRTDESGCITVWLGKELKAETFLRD